MIIYDNLCAATSHGVTRSRVISNTEERGDFTERDGEESRRKLVILVRTVE